MKDRETRICTVDGFHATTWKKASMHILKVHRSLIFGARVSDLAGIVDTIFPPFSGEMKR